MKFTMRIDVVLIEDEKTIMDNAAKLGREDGQDLDWMPENLNEAIYTIISTAHDFSSQGIEI